MTTRQVVSLTGKSYSPLAAARGVIKWQTMSEKPICSTCGTQFPESEPPKHCPICEDQRQFVGWDGQQWTTLQAMFGKYKNEFERDEDGVYSSVPNRSSPSAKGLSS